MVVVWTVLEAVVNAEGLLALLANVLPMAVVVGVWVKILWERAAVVSTDVREPDLVA